MRKPTPVTGSSGAAALMQALKDELKAAGITYAELAERIEISESSVKRMFSRNDMPLSRIDEICNACHFSFEDLARRVSDAQPMAEELTLDQERAVMKDPKLLLVAICVLSQWSYEQILERYALEPAELVARMVQLDKLGVIELKALNRYRLIVAKTFRWHSDGPLMRYFREAVLPDYFSGAFAQDGETVHLIHGSLGEGIAPNFVERIRRLGADFSAQHLADQKLKPEARDGYTLILAMRRWEFNAFTQLRRSGEKKANLPKTRLVRGA
jgi:transcriptional regulator with XRE-family HTH domain